MYCTLSTIQVYLDLVVIHMFLVGSHHHVQITYNKLTSILIHASHFPVGRIQFVRITMESQNAPVLQAIKGIRIIDVTQGPIHVTRTRVEPIQTALIEIIMLAAPAPKVQSCS